MPKNLRFLAWCPFFAVIACIAATNAPPGPVPAPAPGSANALWLTLIPLAVPIIVAVAKTLIGKLPTWSLPILASALGALLNYVSGLAGGPTTSILNGALLGSAGVGIREIVDQLRNINTPSEPPKTT